MAPANTSTSIASFEGLRGTWEFETRANGVIIRYTLKAKDGDECKMCSKYSFIQLVKGGLHAWKNSEGWAIDRNVHIGSQSVFFGTNSRGIPEKDNHSPLTDQNGKKLNQRADPGDSSKPAQLWDAPGSEELIFEVLVVGQEPAEQAGWILECLAWKWHGRAKAGEPRVEGPFAPSATPFNNIESAGAAWNIKAAQFNQSPLSKDTGKRPFAPNFKRCPLPLAQ
jgi:hypothetical protein